MLYGHALGGGSKVMDESTYDGLIAFEWQPPHTAPAGRQRCELEMRSSLLASNWASSHRGEPLRVRIEYFDGAWFCANVWSNGQLIPELERLVVAALMGCGLSVYT
jgi:hypothetical protein